MGRVAGSFLFSILLLIGLTSSAVASVATIVYVDGDGLVFNKKSEKRTARMGGKVRAGEKVETKENCVIILELPDGSRVKINSNSILRIGTVRDQIKLRLLIGSVFSKVNTDVKMKSRKKFRIQAKQVNFDVKGTEFFTAFGKKKKDVWMCVNEGAVKVSIGKSKKKVVVKEGQGVFVKKGKKVTEPKKYSWTKSLNWKMDPKEGDVGKEVDLSSAYSDLLNVDYD